MTQTAEHRTTATFFDGQSAARHMVEVSVRSVGASALRISGPSLPSMQVWPFEDLRALADQSDGSRLVLTRLADTGDEAPRDPARLVITDPEWVAWFRKTRPSLGRTDVHRSVWRRATVRLALAAAAILMMLFVILPRLADTLAQLIPPAREAVFGQAVTGQMERFLGAKSIGALHCTNADGRDALDRLTARLIDNADLDYDITVTVFDHGMVNAFAAPGGRVVLMRGLLEEAGGADAVAAVLAHEIGHVEARDPTRLTLRAAGSAGLLSMVIGDFAGGTLLVVATEHLFQAAYTREAEANADVFALDMLNRANISTDGMASFFDLVARLQGGTADLPEYLSTHPATRARAGQARENATKQSGTRPALDADGWAALRSICD